MKFAIPLSMLPTDEIKPLAIAADEIGYDFRLNNWGSNWSKNWRKS